MKIWGAIANILDALKGLIII